MKLENMAEEVESIRRTLINNQIPVVAKKDLASLIQLTSLATLPYSEKKTSLLVSPRLDDEDLEKVVKKLFDERVIRPDPDFKQTHYQVFDVFEQPPEMVCCSADPFIYVSHLSAMQLQGLSDRSPTSLVVTRPAKLLWQKMWLEAEHHDLALPSSYVPKSLFPRNVRGRPIYMHEIRHPGKWETLGAVIRVATQGQTFLDMVTRPEWCGGILHVLNVWDREAEAHLDEIIAAVTESHAKLPKVRAGYILNEIMGITDKRVLDWLRFAQRGSSQKLDPEKPYGSDYSEKWMIAKNA